MTIGFNVLEFAHSPSNYYKNQSDISNFELAVELEDRYNVIEMFTNDKKDVIIDIIATDYIRALKHFRTTMNTKTIETKIQNLWREYMIKGEHGIVSKRSIDTGTVGLIDTGDYYKSLVIKIKR